MAEERRRWGDRVEERERGGGEATSIAELREALRLECAVLEGGRAAQVQASSETRCGGDCSLSLPSLSLALSSTDQNPLFPGFSS